MLRPLLLKSEVARFWCRNGHWTPAGLAAALGDATILVKRSSAARHFMYTAQGRTDILADTDASTEGVQIAAADFFAALDQPPPPYLYFTSPIETLAEAAGGRLQGGAPGWEMLSSEHMPAGGARPWLQLWAGTAGACTQAHYDVADNLFVQCSGTKEFLLYPPSAAKALHVFPDSHPRARKAQVCLEQPDYSRHPRARQLPAPSRVVLEPGDALFVPAFHIHHVTAASASISLNVFSESAIKLAASVPLSLPPPLHAAWPSELKRLGLETLLSSLLLSLGMPPLPQFATELLDSRFAPLAEDRTSPADATATDGNRPPVIRRRRRPPVAPAWEDLEPSLHAHAGEYAEAFAQLRRAVLDASQPHRRPWRNHACTVVEVTTPNTVDARALADAHYAAIRELTIAHLVELLTVRLFGPASIQAELELLAGRIPTSA
mmetsp:Transcript_51408/g.115440  ORF Transcript_51408/g.115440 Transcript_51408/m.115440 type:complete len:435 (-) Transcript_51408:202-1506(-)